MAKRKNVPPEDLAEEEARYAATTRLLEERIAYHRMKLAEERLQDERRQRLFFRRYWRTET